MLSENTPASTNPSAMAVDVGMKLLTSRRWFADYRLNTSTRPRSSGRTFREAFLATLRQSVARAVRYP